VCATVRERISLDGVWEFRMETESDWRQATVPSVWQTQPDLRHAVGTGIYRRRITIPDDWGASSVALCFGAVSYVTEALFDGTPLGTHEGGWLPFEFTLPRATGAHELVVRVTLPDDDPERFPDWPFGEIPHGKQSWYGKTGGIWQSVLLERRSTPHLGPIRIDADPDSGRVRVSTGISSIAPDLTLRMRIIAPSGDVVARAGMAVSGAADLAVIVTDPRPWSPATPDLYLADVALHRGATPVDRLTKTFGFRSITAAGGRLLLNGAPFVLRGALDQDYYPGTITTPPSLAFLEDQFAKARALGFNCLRCHIKVPDPRYYEVADRTGMLIWADLPNVERFSAAAERRLRDTMRGMMARDGHHPALIAWTLINEDWGTDLECDPEHRAWLGETYAWLKALDPRRLVVDNSPCWPNFHVRSDLDDYHWYYNHPDQRREWDAQVGAFAAGAAWTFSPYGDARRSGDEPRVVSEFGNWGLPALAGVMDPDGSEPWWFETGHERHGGVSLICPHGVAERFATWQLDRIFGSLDGFVDATQRHQHRALKYQIESLRSQPGIAGYVVTELTDTHWEANGLMDMRRNPRPFHAEFADINAATVVVPRLERWSYWPGETVRISVLAAVGEGGFAGGTLHWDSDGATGSIVVRASPAALVVNVGEVAVEVPSTARTGMMRVHFQLRDGGGDTVARNVVDVAVIARSNPAAFAATAVWCATTALRERLAGLGYALADTPASSNILISDRLDDALCEHVRHGSRLLVLARDPDAIEVRSDLSAPIARRFPGLRIVARDWTAWRGISTPAWGWLRRDGAYSGIPGDTLFDFAFDRIIPHHVLVGFGPDDFAARVHAGVIVGWINMPAAYIGQRFLGRGAAIFTTFRLTDDPHLVDPMATVLLDALVAVTLGGSPPR
jgi:hypothetical protein